MYGREINDVVPFYNRTRRRAVGRVVKLDAKSSGVVSSHHLAH